MKKMGKPPSCLRMKRRCKLRAGAPHTCRFAYLQHRRGGIAVALQLFPTDFLILVEVKTSRAMRHPSMVFYGARNGEPKTNRRRSHIRPAMIETRPVTVEVRYLKLGRIFMYYYLTLLVRRNKRPLKGYSLPK